MTYSWAANQVDPPEGPKAPLPAGVYIDKPLAGAEAQARAVQIFGKFAPLIRNYEPSNSSQGGLGHFYTSPHASGFASICVAGDFTIDPDKISEVHATYRRIYRVVGSMNPALEMDRGYEKKVEATCASMEASESWFTAREFVVGRRDLDQFEGSGGRQAEDGARSIDLAVAAARSSESLPFTVECDSQSLSEAICADPKGLLAAIDPRQIEWLARQREFGLRHCRETTTLAMLPQGPSSAKYVITTVEEDPGCVPLKTLHFAMVHVRISGGVTILD